MVVVDLSEKSCYPPPSERVTNFIGHCNTKTHGFRPSPNCPGLTFLRIKTTMLRMGRKKLKRPKKQHHLSLAYLDQLQDIKDKLAPPGLELSDGQAVDVAIATLHELLIQKRLTVVDPDRVVEILNDLHKRALVKTIVDVVKGLGHKDVAAHWREQDGSVVVKCDVGAAVIPPRSFGRVDADTALRDAKTGMPA